MGIFNTSLIHPSQFLQMNWLLDIFEHSSFTRRSFLEKYELLQGYEAYFYVKNEIIVLTLLLSRHLYS